MYYRSLSELYTLELEPYSEVSQHYKEALWRGCRQYFLLLPAVQRLRVDKNNYLNWMTLARVGQAVVPLKDVVAGSYDLPLNS